MTAVMSPIATGASQLRVKCARKYTPGRLVPCCVSQSMTMSVSAAAALKVTLSQPRPSRPVSSDRKPATMASDDTGMMTRLARSEPGENSWKYPIPDGALARNAAQLTARELSSQRPHQSGPLCHQRQSGFGSRANGRHAASHFSDSGTPITISAPTTV